MIQDFKQYSNISLEVQLAWEVMTCRAMRSTYDDKEHPCHWFNSHYGPYPAYDLIGDLPHPSATGEKEPSGIEALCVGERYQVPELMSGCRKAPIMTIGINPNLTAYYPSVDGATWCYPYFDNIGQYAYYFRHRAVCQERFSVDFIRENIIPGTEIVAEEDGKVVKTELSSETGGVNLTIEYNGKSQYTMRLESGYKILFDPYDHKGFAKGEKIAGKIALKPNTKVTLYREPVGYYKQFQSIFDTFKKYAGSEIEKLPLCMGEDVCQGDMVACASPGWGKWFTDNALNGIMKECVHKRKWLVIQLLQTNPQLIVFAGQSAFSMFYSLLKDYIHTDLDLESDTYELLKATIGDPISLKIDIGNGYSPLKSRIVISPHFSYHDNFRPQSRFTKEEWETYSQEYPQSFTKLNHLVKSSGDGLRKLIFMDGKDPTEEEVGSSVWQILQDHLYDAKDMIARIILDEYNSGTLTIEGEHFKRNEGPCNFCINELFTFKEGCPYGKIGTDKKRYEKILQVSEGIFNIYEGHIDRKGSIVSDQEKKGLL